MKYYNHSVSPLVEGKCCTCGILFSILVGGLLLGGIALKLYHQRVSETPLTRMKPMEMHAWRNYAPMPSYHEESVLFLPQVRYVYDLRVPEIFEQRELTEGDDSSKSSPSASTVEVVSAVVRPTTDEDTSCEMGTPTYASRARYYNRYMYPPEKRSTRPRALDSRAMKPTSRNVDRYPMASSRRVTEHLGDDGNSGVMKQGRGFELFLEEMEHPGVDGEDFIIAGGSAVIIIQGGSDEIIGDPEALGIFPPETWFPLEPPESQGPPPQPAQSQPPPPQPQPTPPQPQQPPSDGEGATQCVEKTTGTLTSKACAIRT